MDEKWNEYKCKTKKWKIWMCFEVLHSEAYKSIEYAPALKVFNWIFEKRIVRKTNSRKNRFIEIDEPFSFTFDEGERRGLTRRQLGRAIRELFNRGFIDLEKQGSGLHKDFSLYRFSERWRKYGGPDFEDKEFPKRPVFGCFGEPKRRAKQGQISPLFLVLPSMYRNLDASKERRKRKKRGAGAARMGKKGGERNWASGRGHLTVTFRKRA